MTYIRKLGFMTVTGTHNDTATPASDSGSAFSFTPVNIAPFGDYSEHFHCRVISQMVSTDQIPLNTVSTHLCRRPGTNFISVTGDPVKVVSLFGVRGER